MPVHGGQLRVETQGDGDIIDIASGVSRILATAGSDHGVVTMFVVGSTAAVTTMEYEPGGVADLLALLDRMIPRKGDYEHNRRNRDSNSPAHQRASLIGASESIPLWTGV